MYVIHYWIFRAPPRKIHLWSFCARARRIHLWIYCAGRGNDFLLYMGEKIFCARARRIHLWIYRARARKRFSSLYRGEKFLRSGAENPPLDLPCPGAETIFFSIQGRKFSALGRGESTFGSTAPERGNDFLLYIGEKIFCARGAGESTFGSTAPGFSALGRGESTSGSTAPGRGNDFFSI